MIAVRLLHREEWEKRLRSYGCCPLEGMTQLNTAEWWRWPWGGPPFTVPVEFDGSMDERSFQGIMHDMAQLAPPGWEFSDPYNAGKTKK
jgi:hypothetical protein